MRALRALFGWLHPTRIYEPTGADLIIALRRSGYRSQYSAVIECARYRALQAKSTPVIR